MLKNLISLFIKKEDFRPLKHVILLRNDTSFTSILNKETISIIEMLEDGIILKLPVNKCKNGHLITLFVFTDQVKQKISDLNNKKQTNLALLEVIGKVTNTEKIKDDDNVSVTLKYSQYNEEKWAEFVDNYNKRQIQINSLGT